MISRDVHLKLAPEMHRALIGMAGEDDVSPGQILRNLLADEIRRRSRAARPPVRADERLVAPLRARLAPDLADSEGWDDLQARLREKGYVLRPAGGGLALHEFPDDRRICKASELGFSYSRLMRRFRAPFPGHNHTWLAERMLAEPEDIELIERF